MKDLIWYKRELKARNHPYKVIGEYDRSYKPVLHECKKCRYQITTAPRDVLRNAGCAKCNGTKYKKTHEDYVQELAAVKPQIEAVGAYTRMHDKIKHRCLDCKHEWTALPLNLLKSKFGCPQCASAKKAFNAGIHSSTRKRFRIQGRSFWLQGHEAMAIRWLVNEAHVHIKNVKTEDVPRFRYKFAGKEHWYYPDFMVKHRIVEVKSTYTAGLKRGKVYYGTHEEYWERLKAKAHAVQCSGSEFRLIILDKLGRRVILPKNWIKMDAESVIRAVGPLRSE